jgi:2-dehydropantoate 2-reductase
MLTGERTTRALDNQRRVPEHEASVSPFRLVVMGAGGVGGYFGARLARAGQPVTFVARGPHLAAIRRHGLRVRSILEGEYTIAAEAVERLERQPAADVVLLCVKTYDTESALAAIGPVVGPATAVLSLQNGVDNAERIDAVLGPGHALGGAAYVFATLDGPGVVVHRFGGRIIFGELDGRASSRSERLREAFAAAGVPVELSTDIRRVLWEKYLMICAQAGVTAVTRCPTGVVRAVPETWALYRQVLGELAALAKAAGVALAPDVVDGIMKTAAALAPDTTSSLAHDLGQGRRLELEALHGHGVRLAERLGVPTPALFALYAALKPWLGGRPAGAQPERHG